MFIERVQSVDLKLSAREYCECLAKLANNLEKTALGKSNPGLDQLSRAPADGIESAFARIDAANPFSQADFFQTTLMDKYRVQLAPVYEEIGLQRPTVAGKRGVQASTDDRSEEFTLSLSVREYAEVLNRLAAELNFYCFWTPDPHAEPEDQATDSLKVAFVKLDSACPYGKNDYYESDALVKIRWYLQKLYPKPSKKRHLHIVK